jgi:hypothetical protein
MIESWIGFPSNMAVEDFLELLTDIINEEYTVESFKKDVLEFHEAINQFNQRNKL